MELCHLIHQIRELSQLNKREAVTFVQLRGGLAEAVVRAESKCMAERSPGLAGRLDCQVLASDLQGFDLIFVLASGQCWCDRVEES